MSRYRVNFRFRSRRARSSSALVTDLRPNARHQAAETVPILEVVVALEHAPVAHAQVRRRDAAGRDIRDAPLTVEGVAERRDVRNAVAIDGSHATDARADQEGLLFP